MKRIMSASMKKNPFGSKLEMIQPRYFLTTSDFWDENLSAFGYIGEMISKLPQKAEIFAAFHSNNSTAHEVSGEALDAIENCISSFFLSMLELDAKVSVNLTRSDSTVRKLGSFRETEWVLKNVKRIDYVFGPLSIHTLTIPSNAFLTLLQPVYLHGGMSFGLEPNSFLFSEGSEVAYQLSDDCEDYVSTLRQATETGYYPDDILCTIENVLQMIFECGTRLIATVTRLGVDEAEDKKNLNPDYWSSVSLEDEFKRVNYIERCDLTDEDLVDGPPWTWECAGMEVHTLDTLLIHIVYTSC